MSDPLHDVNLSSICLFRVEKWSTGIVCEARLVLNIKSPEYHLDVVLVTLLVALDGVYTLN